MKNDRDSRLRLSEGVAQTCPALARLYRRFSICGASGSKPALLRLLHRFGAALILLVAFATSAFAGTITLLTNSPGSTPGLLAYNSGHFYPGSNTRDWWHYAGVSGARVFLTASLLEPTDDLGSRGDGVVDQAGFLARKAALRADPLNTNYINWPFFTNSYNTVGKHGANRLEPNYIMAELHKLGVQIDVTIGASQNFFIITDPDDWAGKWELWQHYYAQAFYLARGFDVQRYQMFNEPDHSSAGGLTQDDYLQRLQLCSDAIQSALADVNALYVKALTPKILAPVITTSSYNSWSQITVTNRHLNYLGQVDPGFLLLQQYDYHQYNSTPAQFGANLASLRGSLASAMAPEPVLPVSISEFNVHTAANFDGMADTLDYPTKYPRLGAIFVNLVQNGASELYNFKFSQTDGDVGDNYPVRKNGMHYVDNNAPPYNIGGVTKGGEVWRLFNKAFAPGRMRKSFSADGSLAGLALLASYDPATSRYFLFSANDSSPAVSVTLNVAGLNLPDNQRVLVEEVSEQFYGTVSHYTSVSNGIVPAFTQGSNTVLLITLPTKPEQFVSPNVPTLVLDAAEDATVKDGASRTSNFGGQTNLVIRNDPLNATNRSAALIKFRLPRVYLPDVEYALLTVRGATLASNAPAQAHVYGLLDNGWSQTNVTWAAAPNLLQNIPAGNHIADRFVNGQGDSAFIQGQLVFGSTSFSEQQIDVTAFVRGCTNYDASFLVSQDPRWNVALPSLADGDTQPDGLQLVSSEGGANGPRLLLVRLKDSDGDGVSDEAESNVFGTNANDGDTDHDGFSDGEEILVNGTNPTNPAPSLPVIVSQPISQAVSNGAAANFSVHANGTPPLRYQWFFNQTNVLAGATNAVLSLVNVQNSNAGNYRVTVTNLSGSATSSNAVLSVTAAPPADAMALLDYEPFSYAAGSQLAGQGDWQLNSGTSGTIETGNLGATGLAPALGNRLTWTGASMSLRLPLGTNLVSGQVYFAFALRVDSLGGSFVSDGTLAGFTTGTGTSFGTKINVRPTVTGGYNLGVSKGAGTTFGAWASAEYFTGGTVLVIGRYRFNGGNTTDDLSDLWLNPSPATFGAGIPPAATVPSVGAGGTDLAQIDRFFFRSGGSASSPAKLTCDELRVGYSWASVTPLPPPSLVIAVSNANATVHLIWPTNPPGFLLEQSASLFVPAWVGVTNAVNTAGTNFSIEVDESPSNSYFRLRR